MTNNTIQSHPNLKRPKPLTGSEKRRLAAQKKLQDTIRHGPLFTESTKRDADAPAKTFSEAQFNSQYGGRGKADIDPFHGVETYSAKYAPKKRTIPQLSAQPFNKSLFPEELWSTLDGESGEEVKKHINRVTEKRSLMMAGGKGAADKERVILEKINAATGGGEDGDVDEDDEPAEEEEQDYDFEDDENDMGGDYDGEKYFDNGEDDEGDEDGGGNGDY
jgi:DNA-directed RNA polymerase III subunit RPC7